jgi:hypothetical protein
MKAALSLAALAASASALAMPQKRASSCPADLNGDFTAPQYIVPVDSANPDKAFGTQYDGNVSSTVSTIFQFNVPSSYSGKTCSVIMLLPNTENVQQFSGDGVLNFALMQNLVNLQSTTWNSKGPVKANHGNLTVKEGNNYVVNSFPCTAGYQLPYQVSSATGKTNVTFFEETAAPPTGLYVRAC